MDRRPGTGDDELASVAETLAGLTAAARGGSLDDTAALSALAAARRLAAALERSELALIEAARDGGATWTRIAAAMGARNRQTAQKRHADLARRCPRPPSVDTPPAPPGPRAQESRHDVSPAIASNPRPGCPRRRQASPARASCPASQAAGRPEDH